ncbi:hypothetical protein J7J18_04490 [bacterium]|nr:hypothetical protein [bacterium]
MSNFHKNPYRFFENCPKKIVSFFIYLTDPTLVIALTLIAYLFIATYEPLPYFQGSYAQQCEQMCSTMCQTLYGVDGDFLNDWKHRTIETPCVCENGEVVFTLHVILREVPE